MLGSYIGFASLLHEIAITRDIIKAKPQQIKIAAITPLDSPLFELE